jgi:hypothetical protein
VRLTQIGVGQGGLIRPTRSSFGCGRESAISVKDGRSETVSDGRRAVLLDERLDWRKDTHLLQAVPSRGGCPKFAPYLVASLYIRACCV